jgi:hypothetical protein
MPDAPLSTRPLGGLRSRSPVKISLYLDPSKYWWAYLGIRSNPSLLSQADGHFDRAIFFDHPGQIAAFDAASASPSTRYFYIFWDGIHDPGEIDKARTLLGQGARLTVLVVGDSSRASSGEYEIQALYPEGTLRFDLSSLHFDLRTRRILLGAKVKAILMPLKNVLQSKASVWQMLSLLLGKRKIVFCGSYGTTPIAMEQLCVRHQVDFRSFDGYEYYANEPKPSLESYRRGLRSNVVFLARMFDSAQINGPFFLSAISLLGREYFIERIRSIGLDLFANGYSTGVNINVYTTPFYRQHVFPDFGSVAGAGNYPRLVDLRYFNKQVVEIAVNGELDELLTLARQGAIEQHFEREWALKLPQLQRAMAQPLT